MQIVIPMSGFGERFRRAGYDIPKPLIKVDGKPIIAHVLDMFPGERNVIFICNRDHLETPEFAMCETLERLCPTGRIVAVEPHKLGPVFAVSRAFEELDGDQPVIVNYCDFTCYWDYAHFSDFVHRSSCDGAIPAYTGFHPHMLGSTNYAYVRESGGWVSDIQEKRPFTDTPVNEYASSGTYYFASGDLVRRYFDRMMRQDINLNGEYYVSLAYKPMLADGRRVAVYDIPHFMQWGTPEDLAEYRTWSRSFDLMRSARAAAAPSQKGTVLIPMAGLGARFSAEGYENPKPLIPVSGKPMVVQAVRDLPEVDRRVFVLRKDMPGADTVAAAILDECPGSQLRYLSGVTEGQACTCLAAMDQIDPDLPLTIGACDNGALYDADKFSCLMDDPETDVIIWGVRGHPAALRHPEMYGWVDLDCNRVTSVSVKTPLKAPATDPIVVGTFTFKRAADFRAAAERLLARDGRVNGEFYVDSCINDAIAMGLNCRLLEIDSYLCWGTPNELRVFEYWQSCFHKWQGHPYRLEQDPDIEPAQVPGLAERYAPHLPALPRPLKRAV